VNKKRPNAPKFIGTLVKFLSDSAKYRVFNIKMARIFQQCTNCCEKQDYLSALGLDKKKSPRNHSNNRKFDMKTTIFLKNGSSKKGVESF
jgi:hypothetical protein